jgi:hypothetical protein
MINSDTKYKLGSKANIVTVPKIPKPDVPKTLAEVSPGMVFTGTLSSRVGDWKGLFVVTGGAVVQLDNPGDWFSPHDPNMSILDFEQVDLEIKVVPHVS